MNENDLQALYLSKTYCHKTGVRPPSCTTPREPSIYCLFRICPELCSIVRVVFSFFVRVLSFMNAVFGRLARRTFDFVQYCLSNPYSLISSGEWYIFDVCRYKLAVPCLDVFKTTLDIFQISLISLSRFNHKTK